MTQYIPQRPDRRPRQPRRQFVGLRPQLRRRAPGRASRPSRRSASRASSSRSRGRCTDCADDHLSALQPDRTLPSPRPDRLARCRRRSPQIRCSGGVESRSSRRTGRLPCPAIRCSPRA
jgi:hypothetical protein